MRYYFLLVFLITFLFGVRSQISVTVTPSAPKANVSADSTDVAARAVVKNISYQPKVYFWHRTIVSQSAGWTNMVCDKNFCYPGNVNVKQFTLAGGEEARLDVHIYPKGVEGKAVIDLKITEVGNEANSVTARYNFNNAPTNREVDKASLKVYPNPAKDFFYITENDMVHSVVIYNILGKVIKTMRTANGVKYDISDLPEGLYLVRLTGSNGGTIKTVRLNKQKEKA